MARQDPLFRRYHSPSSCDYERQCAVIKLQAERSGAWGKEGERNGRILLTYLILRRFVVAVRLRVRKGFRVWPDPEG